VVSTDGVGAESAAQPETPATRHSCRLCDYLAVRRRSELRTTNTDEQAIAALASMGESRPAIARPWKPPGTGQNRGVEGDSCQCLVEFVQFRLQVRHVGLYFRPLLAGLLEDLSGIVRQQGGHA